MAPARDQAQVTTNRARSVRKKSQGLSGLASRRPRDFALPPRVSALRVHSAGSRILGPFPYPPGGPDDIGHTDIPTYGSY